MHVRNEIVIAAGAQQIFERARATQHWPQMLPHYRYVRVIRAEGKDYRIVEMAARRSVKALRLAIPVRWRAEQIDDSSKPEIFFRHLGGWTSGMRVYWRFEPLPGGRTRVCIDHELRSPLAPIIARYFIDPIATRTLARMKELCEAP